MSFAWKNTAKIQKKFDYDAMNCENQINVINSLFNTELFYMKL